MHIGLFIDAYHPCIDGAVTAVDNLCQAFGELGHSYTIVTLAMPGYVDKNPETVIRIPSWNFPLYTDVCQELNHILLALRGLSKAVFW